MHQIFLNKIRYISQVEQGHSLMHVWYMEHIIGNEVANYFLTSFLRQLVQGQLRVRIDFYGSNILTFFLARNSNELSLSFKKSLKDFFFFSVRSYLNFFSNCDNNFILDTCDTSCCYHYIDNGMLWITKCQYTSTYITSFIYLALHHIQYMPLLIKACN